MRNDHTSRVTYDQQLDNEEGFQKYIENELKRSLVDKIFSELEKGEKILSLGKIQNRFIPELCLCEQRLKITTDDLVRCKDCANYSKDWHHCHFWDWPMHESDHCSKGKKGENYECKEM